MSDPLPSVPGAGRSKPLVVFDGLCHFCRHWIERWRETTGTRLDYAPLQEVAPEFPQIPRQEFEREIKLIMHDGRVFGGAEAVFVALSHGRSKLDSLPLRAYRGVPGFAALSRAVYKIVARNRAAASLATRWLWGNDVRRPTYEIARTWYLRGLALVYVIAFCSLRVQIDGLIGPEGILPAQPLLGAVRGQLGAFGGLLAFPTLCWWIGAGPGSLHFLCDGGIVLGLLVLAGIAPALCLALLWVFYLSLAVAGQTFLEFQWDILLLEAGFLSIFLAPLQLWPRQGRPPPDPPSRVAIFLLRWLLFRLMLMSGVVKLTSGDDVWKNLTALTYHYETQPLPTWMGWYAAQGADWFGKASTSFMFLSELVAPFLIFGPRRIRMAGFSLLVAFQVLIAATGNYGFFNLLTMVLCLLLLDDLQWPRRLRAASDRLRSTFVVRDPSFASRWSAWVLAPLAAIYLAFGGVLLWTAFFPQGGFPAPLVSVYTAIAPFRSLNGYGLFRVMTRTRGEITIEGSNDGEHWLAYGFRWKPGDLQTPPSFVEPHMPRLDWQMWFAALGRYDDDPWFTNFLAQLLKGSPPVLRLLASNPFPGAPPQYVRAQIARYHFTDCDTRRRTGAWWRSDEAREYCPAISLRRPDER